MYGADAEAPGGRHGVVVGIHGLANKPPADEKQRWWGEAICDGLRRNEALASATVPVEFVYWADLRYDAPLAVEDDDVPYRPCADTRPLPSGGDAPAVTAGKILTPVYEVIDWAQSATGVTPVDDLILEHRFDDLWHYHAEQAFARSVRGRLMERLKGLSGEPVLLVAHSMGSVIAYDVLRMLEQAGAGPRIAHFVTLGSPLGLAKVKGKAEAEFGPLRTPAGVTAWTNLYDGADVVAVAGALASDYAPSAAGVTVRDVEVVNDYRWSDGRPDHHKSYGYLRTPEFSRIARGFTR